MATSLTAVDLDRELDLIVNRLGEIRALPDAELIASDAELASISARLRGIRSMLDEENNHA